MINIINPYGIDNGETIDEAIINRMGARGEVSVFLVKRILDDFNIEISLNGKPRIYRVPRTETQEPIRKNDELILATYQTPTYTIIAPFAFRHPHQNIFFRI